MEFMKMEAAGNDFIVMNGFEYEIDAYHQLARKVCDRHFGVGGDGILVCENSNVADIKMVYYNSDGSKGEMCGNGIRCFSKYVYEEGLVKKPYFTVETLAGIKAIDLEIQGEQANGIKVHMGKPIFEGNHIPVDMDKDKIIEERFNVDGKEIIFSSLFVGVPHTVIFVEDINVVDINHLGRKIETHPLFPRKTNVNFVEVVNKNKMYIYTWERGAGRTLGCGTGSCASVVIGNLLGQLDNIVQVKTEGGELQVQLGKDYEIFLKGGANKICKGVFLNL